MTDTVRVPWNVGQAVGSRPPAPRARPRRGSVCSSKANQVAEDIATIDRAARRVPPGRDRHRERLETELRFQRRRLTSLEAAGNRPTAALETRAAALEKQLGPAAVRFLEDGLPPDYRTDRRLTEQLAELAIVRLALTGDEEP